MTKHMIKTGLLSAFMVSLMLWQSAAQANDEKPEVFLPEVILKEKMTVSGHYVHLGDLFDGVGSKATTVIAAAPAPGEHMQFSSYELDKIAKDANLAWQRPTFLKRITVSRNGYALDKAFFTKILSATALEYGTSEESQIQIFGSYRNIFIAGHHKLQEVEVVSFDQGTRGNRFVAEVFIPGRTKDGGILSITGKIEDRISLPVLSHRISPGDIIQPSDIQWITFPSRSVKNNVMQTENDLVGMTVRRPLQASKIIRRSDIIKQQVVAKSSYVTMFFSAGNLQLSATGRALEGGGIGDIIRVMNPNSSLTVEARIIAADQVSVTNHRPQLASR